MLVYQRVIQHIYWKWPTYLVDLPNLRMGIFQFAVLQETMVEHLQETMVSPIK